MNNTFLTAKTKKVIFAVTLLIVLSGFHSYCQDDRGRSAPEIQNMDKTILNTLNAHIKSSLPHMRSLLIARHGVLVFEQYYNGASGNELQNIQSMTKSITSALIGIAMKDGYIKDLDNKVIDYFPGYKEIIRDSLFKDVTIRHLLTMSSGLDEAPPMTDINIKSVLSQKIISRPGSIFRYSSPSSHLLSGILEKATGKSVTEYSESKLLSPLDIQEINWYKDKNGISLGCGSSLWRPQDILKIGQLYLDKGVWNGKQILSDEYINESTKTQITGDFYGTRVKYGYLWWTDLFPAGYSARGFGDQYLLVIPDLDLVVLCLSDSQLPQFPEHIQLVKDYIIPAVLKKTKK
jgi:CubicO group peptidase (beta-lactamase class C family)